MWKGYWSGWKITCPKCKSRYKSNLMNKLQVMLVTFFTPVFISVYVSFIILENTVLFPLLIAFLSIPFSFGAPLLIEFTESVGKK